MTGHLLKSLRAVVFLSITIVASAGGCNHPRSTPEGTNAASKSATAASNEVSELSPALIGKQITIHGTFSLWGKEAPYILLDNQQGDNQQEVYLEPDRSSGTFTWGKPYSDMDGKLVAAIGILRFFRAHPTPPTPQSQSVQNPPDFFYFNLETTQLRLLPVWYKPDE